MDDFERLANWLNDMDGEWWPFLFLRPEPHRKMTSARVLLLALLYGFFAGMLTNALIALAGQAHRVHPAVLPGVATLVFFAAFRSTFAWAWNRRAGRLASSVGAP